MGREIPFTADAAHRRVVVGGEPMIFHCHHYNTCLQRSILDAEFVDAKPFLIGAADNIAYDQLGKIFNDENLSSTEDRKLMAQELYRWPGFGTFDLSSLDENGGSTATVNSHYSMGWTAKWGNSDEPICFFTTGWIAGALSAIYGKPFGTYTVKQTKEIAMGDEECVFVVTIGQVPYKKYQDVGVGLLSEHKPHDIGPNNVPYEGIFEAVSGMPLIGDDTGTIGAFGVYLTRHYSNYYNWISFQFLNSVVEQFGDAGLEVARPLLIEAGLVCAFNTFGGIMESPEWNALIKPALESKEDWVHGMVAVANALGWGRWQVTDVTEDEAHFVIHDDYESSGYRAMYGLSKYPVSFLAHGGVVGLMNLVYVSDIASTPTLDEDFYTKTFKDQEVYVAEELTSIAMGDDVTSFRVYKK